MAPGAVLAALMLIFSCFQFFLQVGAALQRAELQEAGKPLESLEDSVVVVGNVFCDSCLEGRFTQKSVHLPGATVVIACKNDDGLSSMRAESITDMHGSFKFHLAGTLAMSPLRCIASLKESPQNSQCSIVSRPAYCSSSMLLTAAPAHQRVYSIDSLSFRPREALPHCNLPAARTPELNQNVETDRALDLRSRKALTLREASNFEEEMTHLPNPSSVEDPIEEIAISGMRRSLLQSIPFLGPIASIFGGSSPPPPVFSFPFIPPPPLRSGDTIPGFPTTPTVPTVPVPTVPVPTVPIPSIPLFSPPSNPTTPYYYAPPPPIY